MDCLEQAMETAKSPGNQKLVDQIARRIELYSQPKGTNEPPGP